MPATGEHPFGYPGLLSASCGKSHGGHAGRSAVRWSGIDVAERQGQAERRTNVTGM